MQSVENINSLQKRKVRRSDIARISRTLNSISPGYGMLWEIAGSLKSYFGEDKEGDGLNLIKEWLENSPLHDDWTEAERNEALYGGPTDEAGIEHPDIKTRWIKAPTLEHIDSADHLINRLIKCQRTFGEAVTIDWAAKLQSGKPDPKSQLNVRSALSHLGVELYKNEFDHRYYVEGFENFHELNDEAMRALWLAVDALGLAVSKERFVEVALDVARQKERHPVREYLDSLPKWDGVQRLDGWLIEYAGAEDNELNRQIGRKVLTAAVRRVRQPGAKFDTMLVLQGEQGTGKSSLVRTLAGDWFEDGLLLGADPKTVIEQTNGKWIVEVSELGGLSRREIETVKAMLSRTGDTARLAYDKLSSTVPRQFIMIGTTNSAEFLRDETGNRRFMPVEVKEIKLDALTSDKDQLWAEAAQAEAARNKDGSPVESLELPRELWSVAANVQDQKVVTNPVFELLESFLDGQEGRISKESVREIVRGSQEADLLAANRIDGFINGAMTRLGWKAVRVGSDGSRERVWEKNYREGEPKLRFNAALNSVERGPKIGEHERRRKVVPLPERRAAVV